MAISRILNPEIIALFTKIATAHPSILHLSSADVNRFSGLHPEQLDNDNRGSLNWEKLVLSLSIPDQPGLRWTYVDAGTSVKKHKSFDVLILGTSGKHTDYADDEELMNAAEQVCDDIQNWFYKIANSGENELWPVLDLIDLENIEGRRVYNVGIDGCNGAAIRISLHSNLNYQNDNPLKDIEP